MTTAAGVVQTTAAPTFQAPTQLTADQIFQMNQKQFELQKQINQWQEAQGERTSAYAYKQAMADKLQQPITAFLSLGIITVFLYQILSKKIASSERVEIERSKAEVEIAKYGNQSEDSQA
jgi:hypothetical protein